MDIKGLLSELVEVEYVSIRVELYIKSTDDIKSKLNSGLVLSSNLIRAYKDKIKGLHKYYATLDYLAKYIPNEYVVKMKNVVQTEANYINGVIYGLESGIDNDRLANLIKNDQEIYTKLVHNNNIIMNNLADKYLKEEHDVEDVLETNAIINESKINNENIDFNNQEIKTVYQEHPNTANADQKQIYLFQISEIEKAISEIEGKNEKTRKDINELYQYYNEIIKIKSLLSQYQ